MKCPDCLGVPVRFDPKFESVAPVLDRSRRWWPWRFVRFPGISENRGIFRGRIVVGAAFTRFSDREQQAILLHEVGHVKLKHSRQRLRALWMILFRPSAFRQLCIVQEFQADRFAAECGYGSDLAGVLARIKCDDRPSLYPPAADRIARLLACSRE